MILTYPHRYAPSRLSIVGRFERIHGRHQTVLTALRAWNVKGAIKRLGRAKQRDLPDSLGQRLRAWTTAISTEAALPCFCEPNEPSEN